MPCNTLPFQRISYCKIHLHLAHLKQYPSTDHPKYSERSASFQHCQQPCYSFSKILLTLWGPCFYQNGWKTILFWIHRFFSWRKILMMWIFYLILDFSKETDPTILHKRHHNFSYLLSLNYIYHAKSLCIWETLSSQKEHLKSHTCKKSSVNPQYNNIYNLTNLKF